MLKQDRRHFFTSSLLFFGAAVVGFRQRIGRANRGPFVLIAANSALHARKSILFDDMEFVRYLGFRCREMYPHHCPIPFSDNLKCKKNNDLGDLARLSALLEERSLEIGSDFEQERLVVVDGWVLAQSEAKICSTT